MSASLNDPRYRPALLALAGISAAYAIYLIRQQYAVPHHSSEPQAQLRRRNAVRRHDASRHRRRQSPTHETDSIGLSEQAIAALQTREEEGRSYGFLDIHSIEQEPGQEEGQRRETQWPLLPSRLPTAQHFQSEDGISAEDAEGLRNHAEVMFMDAFLVNEYPPNHNITEVEMNYLVERLGNMEIAPSAVRLAAGRFNTDPNFASEMRGISQNSASNPPFVDGAAEFQRMGSLMHALDGGETTTDGHSNFDWRDGNGDAAAEREEQNTLDLLYNIARDQARRDGYVHRGVECNGCGIMPIQGIRYRCANCLDYDLCDSCEAQELHIKTHVFYKIRVPAPSLGALGNSRQGLPVWYPGKPGAMPRSLPRELSARLLHETGFEDSEVDALWDQFRCLAATEWSKDPNKLGMAIDRKTFDKCFIPPLSIRPPPPNLIYDRMFALYDTDNDGLIGFEEFLKGLASLNDKSRDGRLRRIFQGYDMDNDGYVDRKDFLRMFRAFYTLSKELNRETVAGMEEDLIEGGARDIVHGSQPISSAFPGSIPLGHASRGGVGKELDTHGDFIITNDGGVLDDDSQDVANRHQVIADATARYPRRSPGLRTFQQHPQTDSPLVEQTQVRTEAPDTSSVGFENLFEESPTMEGDNPPLSFNHQSWPPAGVRTADIIDALGGEVSLSEVMDPVDRSRIITAQSKRIDAEWLMANRRRHEAVQERWRRRRFYTDLEEGATAPQGYIEVDSSDDEAEATGIALQSITSPSISRPIYPRSRSSSKVRFEDSVTDTDYETRSNTSSRSIPVGERWGGYDISEIEKDAGKEILYQAVQQGFNELLDQLFKEKEDLTMEAHKTRRLRRQYAKEIQAFADSLKPESSTVEHSPEQEDETAITTAPVPTPQTKEVDLETLLEQAGYSIEDAYVDADTAPEHTSPHTNPPLPPPDHPIYTGAQTYDLSTQDHSTPPPPHPTQAQDPTLPQFLPNEPGTIISESPVTTATDPSPLHPHADNPETPEMPDLTNLSLPTTRTLLSLYLRHSALETEARTRGGFGRLDFDEFVRGMVGGEAEDVGSGENAKKGGRRGENKWVNGGGMGRLGFVGSWIEMACF